MTQSGRVEDYDAVVFHHPRVLAGKESHQSEREGHYGKDKGYADGVLHLDGSWLRWFSSKLPVKSEQSR